MRKTSLLILLLTAALAISATIPKPSIDLYGYIRNDLYYSSRESEAGIDGLFHYYPKPVKLDASGTDINAKPHTNMLSISTRIGINIKGYPIWGAETTGKIEADFAGFGVASYVIRIRQAYMLLNWEKSALQIGQSWHPLWGAVAPVSISLNAGMPFQPFNRSPQIRYTFRINDSFSLMGAAIYQMQYSSGGPKGFSPAYMRNALIPELFGGIEYKNQHWLHGTGIDFKTIKPDHKTLSSLSAVAYTRYSKTKFTAQAKLLIGQNLSDQLLANGYGKTFNSNTGEYAYTNLNIFSSWLNLTYGKKWQISLFGGFSQNLGSKETLHIKDGKITVYSRGFYAETQEMINRMYRFAPTTLFNLPNLCLGVEYNLSAVEYGIIRTNGKTSANYTVSDHRIICSVNYYF